MAPALPTDPTFADWLDRVREELGGRDPLQALTSHPVGAPSVRPLYTASDRPPTGARPLLEPPAGHVAIRPAGETATEINVAILAGLAGGASMVRLPAARMAEEADLERALEGVLLDAVVLHLEAGAHGASVAQRFRRWLDARDTAADGVQVRVGADPLAGFAARTPGGRDLGSPENATPATASAALEEVAEPPTSAHLPQSIERHLQQVGELAATCDAELPAWRAVDVDGAAWHGAGAAEAEELGAVLATTLAYLRAMEAAGLTGERAWRQIGWSLALGRDLFLQIAKLRAARLLWRRLQAALEVESPPPLELHAAGSRRTLTRYDRWANILRGTTQAAAALLGGADTVLLEAYDAAVGPPSEGASRLALNTLHVLELESALASIADPAGGSFYVESLTDELARSAWAEMRRIEAEGGMAAALTAGGLRARIADTAAERRAAIAGRREPIVGVSEFADLGGDRPPGPEPGHSPDGRGEDGGQPVRRDAEDFERLRDAALRAPEPPRVFLANLGPVRRHGARTLFATNALAAGGIGVVAGEGTGTGEAEAAAAGLADAFRKSGLAAASLCGDDELYAALGPAAVVGLKAAGASLLCVAAPPGEVADALLAAGADELLHDGCDLVERLRGLHEALGIASGEGRG